MYIPKRWKFYCIRCDANLNSDWYYKEFVEMNEIEGKYTRICNDCAEKTIKEWLVKGKRKMKITKLVKRKLP